MQPHLAGPCKVPWELSPQIISWGGCSALWSQKQWETQPVAPWPLCCRQPVGKGLGSARRDGAKGRNKGLAFSAGIRFHHSTAWSSGLNCLCLLWPYEERQHSQSCAFKQVAGENISLPLRCCSDHQYGHFSSCDDTGGCLPSRPHLALKEPCVGLEGKTRVLALDKMEWPLPADVVSALSSFICLLSSNLNNTAFSVLDCIPCPPQGSLLVCMLSKSYGLCFPPNACKPSLSDLTQLGRCPGPPNVSPRVRGLGFSGHCWKWDGVAEGRQMPPIALPSSLPGEALCSHTVVTLTTATCKERPAVKTQLNACLCAVESGSLSRMLFLFLNMNGFANKLILVYNWLTQHFFFCFLSFFPLSLLSSFFSFVLSFFPFTKKYFYKRGFHSWAVH